MSGVLIIINRIFLILVSFIFSTSVWANQPTVVVAANMKPAMDEIYQEYKNKTGQEFRIIYGSSGNLTRQIQQGAPFHLLISADESFPLILSKGGLTVDDGKIYAIGRLAFIANPSKKIYLTLNESDLKKMIQEANRVALAKPDLAPYGRAAIEVLTKLQVEQMARKKFVFGESISSVTSYVTSGAADIGLTAYSLAKTKPASEKLNHLLIPESWHQPIRQRMVLIKNPPPVVLDFYRFMQSDQAKKILQFHGYGLP